MSDDLRHLRFGVAWGGHHGHLWGNGVDSYLRDRPVIPGLIPFAELRYQPYMHAWSVLRRNQWMDLTEEEREFIDVWIHKVTMDQRDPLKPWDGNDRRRRPRKDADPSATALAA